MSRRPPASDSPASHCHPHSNHLPKPAPGPLKPKPKPTRTTDLDSPYSAYPAVKIAHLPGEGKYAYGLGRRQTVTYATYLFDKWIQWSFFDHFALYFNSSPLPVASDTVMDDQVRYPLSVEGEHIPEGDVEIHGLVQRAGSGNQSTSPVQTILVKRSQPGGTDERPDEPWHSNLTLSIVGFPEGAILNPDNVGGGVTVKIAPYENIRRNDLIRLSWHGVYVLHRVTEDEAAGLVDILIFVDITVILAGNLLGPVIVIFTVQDVVENPAGDKYPFSKPYVLDSQLDPNLRTAPLFERNKVETDLVDWDIHSGDSFQLRCFTDRTIPAPSPRRYVVVTVKATLADGTTETVTLAPKEDLNTYNVEVPLPNELIENWVGALLSISFIYYEGNNTIRGQSGSTPVRVVGTKVDMPPPDYQPINQGLVDPDVTGLVGIPRYKPFNPGWIERLFFEHIPQGGGGSIIYEDSQIAGPEEGFRTITPANLAPFNGKGDTNVYYVTEDGSSGLHGGAGTQAIRRSQSLTIQVGPLVPNMDPADLQGALLGNWDPNDVVGDPLLTLFPTISQAGDILRWRMVGTEPGGTQEGSFSIFPGTAGQELAFTVSRQVLAVNNGGGVQIDYNLERPETPPKIFRSALLNLSVGKAVGVLKRPEVQEAQKNPDRVLASAITSGPTIEVGYMNMVPSDQIRVCWTGQPGLGTYCESRSGNASKVLYVQVPPEHVAASIQETNSSIDVQYFVTRGLTETPSQLLTLELVPPALMGAVIEGHNGSVLNISAFVGVERVLVLPWLFAHALQTIWLTLEGVYDDDSAFHHALYTGDLLTADGVINGIAKQAPIAELRKLKDGSRLTLRFWVGFGRSPNRDDAVQFEVRDYTVQATPAIFPVPKLFEATGSGLVVDLNVLNAQNGGTVEVSFSPMHATDIIELEMVGAIGAGSPPFAPVPGSTSGVVSVPIPKTAIAANVGNALQTFTLRYHVVRNGDRRPSETLTVRVAPIPSTELQKTLIRINNQLPGTTLDIAALSGGAMLRVGVWAFIEENAPVWLDLISTRMDGTPHNLRLWDGAAGSRVNPKWLSEGHYDQAITQAYLNGLKDGGRLDVRLKVALSLSKDESLAIVFPEVGYFVKNTVLDDYTNWEDHNWNSWRNIYASHGYIDNLLNNNFWRSKAVGAPSYYKVGIRKVFFNLTARSTYEVSCRVRIEGNPYQPYINFTLGTESRSVFIPNANGAWISVAQNFTLPSDFTTKDLELLIRFLQTKGECMLDNIRVRKV
ncbi:hypothetical protein SB759_13945 [Pseudomonas sp. SIMBA_059]